MIVALLASLLAAAGQGLPRAIEIWSEHPIAVEIAWLTIDEVGTETVTARRRTAVGPPVPLEFVHGADRYVRFSYQGASPRTYSTGELLSAKRLHVPDVLPGGELLLHVPPMTVRPVQLLVDGPRVHAIVLDGMHASLAGVPPGEYRVTRVYEGGLRTAAETVAVRATETTLAHFPPEDVGAVRITAASDVCDTATEVTMDAFVMPPADPKFKVAPGRSRIFATREPRCQMAFGGLPPGQLEIFYRRDGAPAGSSLFQAAAQTVTEVTIAGAPVTVEGRVTLNGKPLAATAVSFMPRPVRGERPEGRAADAKTDAYGNYRVSLEAPGPYMAMVRRPRTPMASQPGQITLVEGRNFHDIALTGGTITIELSGWPDGAAVQVRIQSASPGSSSIMVSALKAGEPTAFEGLAYGEYKVSVFTPSTPPARTNISTIPPDAKTVILSPASPDAKVRLDRKQ